MVFFFECGISFYLHLLPHQLLNLLLQLFEPLLHLRQTPADDLAAQGAGIIVGRAPGYGASLCFDGFRDATLSVDPGSVCDLQVTDNTRLSADHRTIANLRTSTNPRLRGNDRVMPNLYIVRDLYQVIELGAFANNGRPNGGPVDSAIDPDLYIIFHYHITDLGHFLERPIGLRSETEPIPPITDPA